MRFNEKEMMLYANSVKAVKEGRVYYKNPNASFREGYKERWFKLSGNLLFYYRVNEYGAVCAKEPIGVLLMEQCLVRIEDQSPLSYTLSLTFEGESDKKHYIACPNQKLCDEWLRVLSESSYQTQRNKLLEISNQIKALTGSDPLASYSFQTN